MANEGSYTPNVSVKLFEVNFDIWGWGWYIYVEYEFGFVLSYKSTRELKSNTAIKITKHIDKNAPNIVLCVY